MRRSAGAIEEGVAIASAAARLSLRNRILMGTIAEDGSFDESIYEQEAAQTLISLATESEEAAERLASVSKRAKGRRSDSFGTHDYRNRDLRNLRKRAKQSVAVAQRLRAMAEDPQALETLVESAREAAWHDVRVNLDRRLKVEGMRPDQDPDYDEKRDARMAALKSVDLAALAVDQRVRGHAVASDGSGSE